MEFINVLDDGRLNVPLSWLHTVVASLSTPHYAGTILQLFEEATGADAWALVKLEDRLPSHIELAAGGGNEDWWSASGERFINLYAPFDPFGSACSSSLGDEHLQILLSNAADIRHPAYRAECYEEPHLGERMSTRMVMGQDNYQINVYRLDSRPPFDHRAVRAFIDISKLIVATVAHQLGIRTAHTPQKIPSRVERSQFRNWLQQHKASLSEREIEVIDRAVRGETVVDTALALSLSTNSVSTYRRRGYSKLGIANTTELLRTTFLRS